MAGISSKAASGLENKKGYNGNEIQNKEFNDGIGLEFYDFNARTYDQQIGRFLQIDPLSDEESQESWTSYHFTFNNPILYNDPDGKHPWVWVYRVVRVFYEIDKMSQRATAHLTVIKRTPIDNVNVVRATPTKALNEIQQRTEAKKFGGQNDTESKSQNEALRNAKDQNGIPRSQQPDKTTKPNTPEGNKAALDNRNVRQYEYTNSKGEKVTIRQDKGAKYPDGGSQPPHFNAGKGTVVQPKNLNQHHNYLPWEPLF